MIKQILISSILLVMVGCSADDGSEINIPLKDMSGKIVIQGNVVDSSGPFFVKITKSVGISGGNYPTVDNAKVIITDDQGQTENLVYDDGLYQTTHFTTNYGRTYTLSVTVDGKTYTASSKMPDSVPFTSLQQTIISDYDGQRIGIKPIFTDPQVLGNYYLFKTLKNSDNSEYTVISDNNTTNGKVNDTPIALLTNFKKNDTVVVEMNTIDQPVFNYFKALPQANLYNSGTAVTPVNPPSNFNNGALGYFSAHTSQYKAMIIQ